MSYAILDFRAPAETLKQMKSEVKQCKLPFISYTHLDFL